MTAGKRTGRPPGRKRKEAGGTRASRLIAAMRRDRGYLYPEWEFVARQSPEFVAAYNALYRHALAAEARLPVKYRELVALGILAFRGESQGLVYHIRRALEHGATRDEVLGALEAAMIPGGALTFLNGLRALAKVVGEPAMGSQGDRRSRRVSGHGNV